MTSTQTIQQARSAAHGDRGSLAMVMVVVIVGVAMAALMLPLVFTQTGSTAFETSRGQALHAAQSGLDMALGDLRTGNAVCETLTGSANGATTGTYQVTINYYDTDPRHGTPTPIRCTDSMGLTSYLTITSVGTDPTGVRHRTLKTMYVTATHFRNSTGGAIRLFPGSDGTNRCLTTVNDTLTLATCGEGGTNVTAMIYTTDLTLQVEGGKQCVTHTGNSTVTIDSCEEAGAAPDSQVWFHDENYHFVSKIDTVDTAGIPDCLTWLDDAITVSDCDGDNWTSSTQSWLLTPNVTAGYAEESDSGAIATVFGRCLDSREDGNRVTVRSCETNQGPALPSAQQWTVGQPDDSGAVQLENGSDNATCLLAPADIGPASLGACGSNDPTPGDADDPPDGDKAAEAPGARWFISRAEVDADGKTDVDASFTIHPANTDGQPDTDSCLTETRNDANYNRYLLATITSCDGSLSQKWNVPLHPAAKGAVDLHEVSPADAAAPPVDAGDPTGPEAAD